MPDIPPASMLPSGWYRLTKDGWERVADAGTPPRDLPDDPFNLVLIENDAEDVPLW